MSNDSVNGTPWRHKISHGNVSNDKIEMDVSNTGSQASIISRKLDGILKWRKLFNYKIPPAIKWWFAIFPLTAISIWSLTYILFGSYAIPGGSVFALAALELLAILLGHVAEYLNIPPAFGMISAGILLRNLPIVSTIGLDLDPAMTNPLRAMSVVVLLSRGAFAVNPKLILEYKWVIPPLYFGSCVIQACTGAMAVYFIIGYPLQWCAAIGCIFSAMSGSIVMPYLLKIEKRGLGLEHGVLAIAKQASGLDAILAISLTELAFGFIFANGDLVGGLEKGAMEVVFGFLFGLFWGFLAGVMFEETAGSPLRTFIVFAGGSMSLLGLTTIGRPRGGPLGCYFGALAVAVIWNQKDATATAKVSANLTILWYFFQPLLFGIIGSRVDLTTVNWYALLFAALCHIISILVRMCASYLMLTFAEGMTAKEKLFIVVAWIPKGTVQAALGPVALETALSTGFVAGRLPYDVLCISALVIVVGTLFGPLLLLFMGPNLLRKENAQV